LKSIRIPASIRALEKNWHTWSSLAKVIFESDLSVQAMLGRSDADLKGRFDIYVVGGAGIMNFPGYSVSIIPGVNNSVRLVKKIWKS
jgi:hypothetical protein